MATELPKVEQEFDANVDPYIAGIDEMMAKNADFLDQLDEIIGRVGELEVALDSLPRDIVITIRYEEIGRPDIIGTAEQTVNVKVTGAGTNLPEAIQKVTEQQGPIERILPPGVQNIREQFPDVAAQVAQVEKEANALRLLTPQLAAAANEANMLRDAEAAVSFQASEAGASMFDEAAALNRLYNDANQVTVSMEDMRRNLAGMNDIFNSVDFNRVSKGFLEDANAGLAFRNATVTLDQDLTQVGAAMDILSRNSMEAGMAMVNARQGMEGLSAASAILDGSAFRAAKALVAERNAAHDAYLDNAQLVATIRDITSDLEKSNAEGGRFSRIFTSIGAAAAGIGVPLGLAAFGITGLASGLHLIVMGTAEFLAVFLPAMYAAGAGAAVMLQASQQVVQRISAIYTVTEAIGPSLNTTAGDFLGLGHSLQNAQNMAEPGVYELLGEAIQAVNNYTGGAKTTLSEFGKTGLGVVQMLDQFGAKVAADMAGPLGGTLHSLVSKAVDDLRTFGSILGNILHVIANLAAAMPGLAEVLLHVINGFTELVKWVSSLPPALITAIFVIEEMYRWSGILVGVFGLLGRALALVATLGIPAFLQIGKNFALMAVGLIDGMAGLVGNLGKGIAVIAGLFSGELADKIGMAASNIVGKLGIVADFLKGPWGIAIGLGIVAIGAMVFWMSKWKSATQEFIDGSNRAVQAASNLQALNVIAQQSTNTTQKLADQQSNLGKATRQASGGVDVITGRLTGQYKPAIDQAISASDELARHQQQLGQQASNLVQGATAISQKYGVDYPTALAIADLAGVKLANTQVNFADKTNKAAIQIESLINSYGIMNSKSGMLVNGIDAVNLQAGIQASQIGKLNTAWDNFIKLSTSVTSTFSQFQADLSQMGNIAPVVGSKISAFSGQSALSFQQVQAALKTFGGNSNQVWQSFDQSISSANNFLDQMRTAQSLNVISSGDMAKAVGGIVNQLIPYASQSKAALAQVMALAQEAGGPAYNNSKSLTQNYQALTDWTGKVGGKTADWNGLLTKTVIGLSNVGKLAAQFANSLQSDVINAIAGAAAQTGKVTTDTLNYIKALQQYGATSPQAMSAQSALTSVMNAAHIPTKDQNQITSDLASTYGKTVPAATAQAGGAMDNLKGAHLAPLGAGVDTNNGKMNNWAKFMTGGLQSALSQTGANADNLKNAHLAPLSTGIDTARTKAQSLTNFFNGQMAGAMSTAGNNATSLNNNHLNPLQNRFISLRQYADNVTSAISKIPSTHPVNITETGKGTFTISQLTGGHAAGPQAVGTIGKAAGGKIPGYGGGDVIPALLEPGEAVVPKHLVHAIAPFLGANRVPGFASGGFVDNFSGSIAGLPAWTTNEYNKSVTAFTNAMESSMDAAMKSAETQAQAAAAGISQFVKGGAGYSAFIAAATKAIQLTGVPMSWLPDLSLIALYESGYNPNAINLTDSNAARGDPSRGYMQTIMSTFLANHVAGTSYNIYDPVANIAAAIEYILRTYGSVFNVPGVVSINRGGGYVGYDNGGWLMPGMTLALNNTGQPERVIGPGGGDGGTIHISEGVISINLDGKQIWTNQQQYTLKYNMRNRGQITGGWSNINK